MAVSPTAAGRRAMASKEPTAGKEPSARRKPSADKEPLAGKEPSENTPPSAQPHWWSVTVSVLAAAIGVQSHHNYRRDFASATPLPFILLGVIFTVILVASLLLLVRSIAH